MPCRTAHVRRWAAACALIFAVACSSSHSPAPAVPTTLPAPVVQAPIPPAPTLATVPPLKPRLYAALGDSYAAGEGLPPYEAGACHQSASAYPSVVAAQ